MKRILATILALILLTSLASAEVCTTGNVNLRLGPGLEYAIFKTVDEGTTLTYLGQVSTDDRGVDWYEVYVDGQECWISSKYSAVTAEFTGETIELSEYYLTDLEETAAQIGLASYQYVSSQAPNQFSNASVTLGANDVITMMDITGPGYTLFGVGIGTDIEEAKTLYTEAGLHFYMETSDVVVFEHPAGENALINLNGVDSCINLNIEDGKVTQICWSTYSG